MKLPLQIRFLGMEPSEALESTARSKAEKLDRFCPDISSCRVTIEQEQKHQHQGRPFAVRVDLTVPGHELSVDRVRHEDAYVALRDAFDDMRRRVEDSVRRTRGKVKEHAVPLHGSVVRFGEEGRYGFIRTSDEDDYYFDAESMAEVPFEHVEIGSDVQFIPEIGAEGRQAKRVSLGKHRVV